MKIVGVLYARMWCDRFPGKALVPLAGKPVIYHCLQQLREVLPTEDIYFCTTAGRDDDELVEWWNRQRLGPEPLRNDGTMLNGLKVLYGSVMADVYVSLGCDTPLAYTGWAKRVLPEIVSGRAESVALYPPLAPTGMGWLFYIGGPGITIRKDAEKFLDYEAPNTREKFHPQGDPAWAKEPKRTVLLYVGHGREALLARPGKKDIDYPADAAMLGPLFRALYQGKAINTLDAIEWLDDHPEVAALNAHCRESAVNHEVAMETAWAADENWRRAEQNGYWISAEDEERYREARNG